MTNRGARFEDFVAELLSRLGFIILGKRIRVFVNGNEVGEVDILAQDAAGNKYAVEVKSGKIDVTGIRQAYVNAKILNARPLIVARGFSNTSAEALARELGVETITLDENVLVKAEELMIAIEMALYKFLEDAVSLLEKIREIAENERLSNAITRCDDWACMCRELGLQSEECGTEIMRIRNILKTGNTTLSFTKIKALIRLYRLLKCMFQKERDINPPANTNSNPAGLTGLDRARSPE
ncbi:MAG: endonuclease [Crenarchaeota archaeon]|nr:endonuclease [Thermoproteota archaeon]